MASRVIEPYFVAKLGISNSNREMRTIYLDYCSSTPVAGSVRDAMLPYLTEHYADPHSPHWMGRVAQEAIEDARGALASLLNCHPTEIVFTSGGTESINLGLLGAANEIELIEDCPAMPHMIISAIEHPVVSRCAELLMNRGWRVTRVGCDRHGVLNCDQLESALTDDTRLVSVMLVNHEVGTIQPIREIADLCAGRDLVFHTDACQAVGKLECDVEQLQVDMLSLSGHKIHGPKGTGALYIRSGVPIQPIFMGDYQESGLRPGMENVPNIVGLGQAARLAIQHTDDILDRLAFLRDRFLAKCESLLNQSLIVHGHCAKRMPGILSLAFAGRRASEILKRCPELCLGPVGHDGLSDSCVGMAVTLAAMGVQPPDAASTLRISFGWTTTEEEVDRAAELLAHAYETALN